MIYNAMNDVYISGIYIKYVHNHGRGGGRRSKFYQKCGHLYYFWTCGWGWGVKIMEKTRTSFMDGPFEGFPRLF